MKRFLFVIVFLLTTSVCFGQVNEGINTRGTHKPFVIDSADTDTTEVIIDLTKYDEQGWMTLIVGSDSTKSFNAWFSSGAAIRWWGTDTTWTDRVQCMWAEEIAEKDFTKPINVNLLQSGVLADSSDKSIGYVPGCDLFRVSIEPTTEAGDDISGVAILRFK